MGGALLALIEGVGFFMGRAMAPETVAPQPVLGMRGASSSLLQNAPATVSTPHLANDYDAQTLMSDFGTDDFTFDDHDDFDD